MPFHGCIAACWLADPRGNMLLPRTLSLALAAAFSNTAIAALSGATILCAAMSSALAQPAERFANPARFTPQSGEALYADICRGCHMPDGVGAVGAGAYPSLARNPKLATAGYPLFLVIHGRKGMPAFGKLLTDQQVAAVINYIRTHFGNDFPDEVGDDDARAAR
jgi:mono/diheme cytochrome c family protein